MVNPAPLVLAAAATVAGIAALCVLAALGAHLGAWDWSDRLDIRLRRLVRSAWEQAPGTGVGAGPKESSQGRPVSMKGPLSLIALSVAGGIAGWMISGRWCIALGVAIGLGWLVRAGRRGLGPAERRRFGEGLEEALEGMVAALRAGRGLAQAVEDAAERSREPVRSALQDVVLAVRTGRSLASALAEMARRWPVPEATYLVACLETHSRTGSDVTALLVNLAGVLRQRRHLSCELGAKTGEARSTGVLLALLPPGLLFFILWADPAQFASLLQTSFGVVAVVYAAVSWLVGVVVTRKMLAGLEKDIEEEG
jgi:Flp pilus assembly protein TadB